MCVQENCTYNVYEREIKCACGGEEWCVCVRERNMIDGNLNKKVCVRERERERNQMCMKSCVGVCKREDIEMDVLRKVCM